MINNKILIYTALLITFVRFFIPLHPDFDTLLIWLFILYLSPIILCIIAFKSDKLLATMVMIPNLMGIGYRLFIFFYD
ncbi:hypothetical protein [Staphylococcus saccharolyticus]|uniref:hypothetical protein n=1 Tax=Staphylococcus saccharolyticus TaxID=33028 RepID=UPI00102D723A|nr:hypothetical protein [Staphylococcus saccharolyticus]MBL7574045.1 hypothetical protein [Staphylococcus saccharolyticus]MBL7585048.1 hypothetical protein [Staphylococcus saccharolyticus]MBL7639658.1 hypothetical protein [Staphylococcus saccharolyticus]QRJ68367.1 hypothetical protein DMB75_010900 [Staphylococcus saccharolyticus]TAA91531.1 hypothetical protein DMB74_09955 [Staphylococcus saccharolyticus]